MWTSASGHLEGSPEERRREGDARKVSFFVSFRGSPDACMEDGLPSDLASVKSIEERQRKRTSLEDSHSWEGRSLLNEGRWLRSTRTHFLPSLFDHKPSPCRIHQLPLLPQIKAWLPSRIRRKSWRENLHLLLPSGEVRVAERQADLRFPSSLPSPPLSDLSSLRRCFESSSRRPTHPSTRSPSTRQEKPASQLPRTTTFISGTARPESELSRSSFSLPLELIERSISADL